MVLYVHQVVSRTTTAFKFTRHWRHANSIAWPCLFDGTLEETSNFRGRPAFSHDDGQMLLPPLDWFVNWCAGSGMPVSLCWVAGVWWLHHRSSPMFRLMFLPLLPPRKDVDERTSFIKVTPVYLQLWVPNFSSLRPSNGCCSPKLWEKLRSLCFEFFAGLLHSLKVLSCGNGGVESSTAPPIPSSPPPSSCPGNKRASSSIGWPRHGHCVAMPSPPSAPTKGWAIRQCWSKFRNHGVSAISFFWVLLVTLGWSGGVSRSLSTGSGHASTPLSSDNLKKDEWHCPQSRQL